MGFSLGGVGKSLGKIQKTITTGGLNLVKDAFGKPASVPGFDYGPLEQRARASAEEQKGYLNKDIANRRAIISSLSGKLQPLSDKFKTERGQLGTDLQARSDQALGQYATDIGNLSAMDKAANAEAANLQQERAFRTLPAQQQAIREALAGQGLLNTGAAGRRLSQPVQEAARSVSDFSRELELNRLAKQSQRAENVALAGLDTRKQTALARMGIDNDTINYLNQIGRQDILNEAAQMAGLSQEEAQGLSGISQNLVDVMNQTDIARQAQNIAQAQQQAAQRNAMIQSLLTLGGTGAGFAMGGPMGAALGGQLGQTAGGLATGNASQAQFNPALLFALQNQKRG